MKKIIVTDYDYEGVNDAGDIVSFKCPECGQTVNVCISGGEWWNTKCECGYIWYANFEIIGEK